MFVRVLISVDGPYTPAPIWDRQRANYFDLRNGCPAGSAGQAPILTRLWAKSPGAHRIAAPPRPSSRGRSQPYLRLR